MTRTAAKAPLQRVVKIRRDYNAWVASETMEDYALRYTPRSARKWSAWRVANTAFGASSFLVLEAVGATLLVRYGFTNAALAILATGLMIFLAGLPISSYAARHGVDMDLLTRGAGFGYMGSTITSLIYASFTFIFFALEAAIMAYALELAFDIPPAWGYLICALVVLPLVAHGVTAIGRLQLITQPLWLVLLITPYVYVYTHNPGLLDGLMAYGGALAPGSADPLAGLGLDAVADGAPLASFDLRAFGAALTVGLALLTQMGEQADYLRFMPPIQDGRQPARRLRWWSAVLIGGPGWVVPGVLKMLGGALLAYLAITHSVPLDRAVDPNQMYLAAYEYVFPNYGWAVAATALFVVVSQLKINVTNAYAGSLAWSNFFSRVAHSHPGRVVWVLFNTAIALLLMELDVFAALGGVLGLYANIAISWLMAVVADLVINKPLGLSPQGIEFRRAYLYDVNPVGVGAMSIASLLSVAAHLGAFGPMAQAWSAMIALVTAVIAAPAIAWATKGRYYLARRSADSEPEVDARRVIRIEPVAVSPALAPSDDPGRYAPLGRVASNTALPALQRCTICERDYEGEDMAFCPAYQGAICSLCCTLDARCNDLCKPQARLSAQWSAVLARLLPGSWMPTLDKGLGHYLLLMLVITPLLAMVFTLLYHEELGQLAGRLDVTGEQLSERLAPSLRMGFIKAYAALLLVSGVVAWWLVLAHKSRLVAQTESNRQTEALHAQTEALQHEIDAHQRTDAQLQEAKRAADAANQAKSRYITTISHELRTPLNSILGYAQLLEDDPSIPPHRRGAVSVIRRGGDHLLSLIEGTLDIARIENGRLTLDVKPMRLQATLAELSTLFEVQAAAKGLSFRHEGDVPAWVRGDEKRLRQILINLIGNAVKFTARGHVTLRCQYAREMARFEIEDSGPGMSADELDRVFEPFARGSASGGAASGSTGLGLTIARMLTGLMGGELTVTSQPGVGTTFCVRLFLPEMAGEPRGVTAFEAQQAARSRQPGPGGVPVGEVGAVAMADTPGGQAALREHVPVHTVAVDHPSAAALPAIGGGRRILCVDNEETDRRLLVDLLGPLGFDIQQAASGEAALALLQAQAEHDRPDAILLDLAMPGIDGWTTLARLRELQLSQAPVAIVSANAFDKLLLAESAEAPRSAAANQLLPGRGEIGAADFFVKPVRVAELVDWLLRRLPDPNPVPPPMPMAAPVPFSLPDVAAVAPTVAAADAPGLAPAPGDPTRQHLLGGGPAAPAPALGDTGAAMVHAVRADTLPTAAPERLRALRAAVDLGHVRGVLTQLDALEAEAPAWSTFAGQARTLARQFQLGAVDALLDQAMKDLPRA
ncbi:MAG: response regulator [Burkholderiales bacterium]|nr:response regulator [Burkholderiales bacterium]